ncbi:MAG: hypothetical protein U0640_09765 [Phycisphaerales bacterium]
MPPVAAPKKVTDLGFKLGQTLHCTVTKVPLRQDTADTIARLMRLDPANKKALKTAHRKRQQREVVYNRGNRDWVKREKTAKVVWVAPGANWSMPFTFDLANDLARVTKFVDIKAK